MITSPLDDATVDRLRAALGRISRRIDRHVSGDGLTRTELSVLASVDIRGPIGLGELGDYEGVNPTMLSRVVGKLEGAGLIRRQADPDDRRAVRVEVTADGAALRHRLLTQRSQLLSRQLADLPDETMRSLVTAIPALEALAEQLGTGAPARATAAPVPLAAPEAHHP
jgi:DNA-binding MarR family transcriptional regulator